MRILCAIVEPTADLVPLGSNTDLAHRRRICPKPIGDDAARSPVFLHDPLEKFQRRGFVPPRGDHSLQDLAFMVDCAPEITELADYDQHGALRRRHVIAFAVQAIGKESDDIEENEFIGEDAGPAEHPMASNSSAKVAAFVAETQQSLGTSDRELLGRAKVSPHSLKRLRAGKRVGDDLLHRLASAAEKLRVERGPAVAERDKWLQIARKLMVKMGGRNKLAAALGVSGPYLGRVLSGKKPMTAELIERLKTLLTTQKL
jgi:transcriptional regulator with XRE-family HTH domain